MGGNLSVNGKQADKVDLKFVGVKNFRQDFHDMFIELSRIFNKQYGEQLWTKAELDKAEVYNGSTSFIMSSDYDVDEILAFKPKSGDIDIITPSHLGGQLVAFLKNIEGKQITKVITYRGSNRDNDQAPGNQINTIFDYVVKGTTIGVQVDLELLSNGDLTWKRFSHSSSFDDAKVQLKGYSHKMLMRAMHSALSTKDALIVSPTAKCDNWEKKLKKVKGSLQGKTKVRILKFSVDKGVSAAYEPMLDCDGNEVMKDGLYVWREIPSKDRKHHETNLHNIFLRLFGKEPSKKELEQMWSFVGLIELIKKYSDSKVQQLIFDRLFELFWGKGEQGIEKNDPDGDAAVKVPTMELFVAHFPKLAKEYEKRQPEIDDYYKNYRMTESLLEMFKNMKYQESL
jgi:hypothetical protein